MELEHIKELHLRFEQLVTDLNLHQGGLKIYLNIHWYEK